MTARLLCILLADPSHATRLTPDEWTSILTIAHAERLAGSLAHRLASLPLPAAVQSVLDAARLNAEAGRVQALWEVEMAHRALAPLGIPVVLLKGSAFAAAGLSAAQGRQIGDLDILVPRDALDAVEALLRAAGWEWVKPDPYDDMYYRKWMHELPPLIHAERDRMIDVHHTILPLTARPKVDAAALMAEAVALSDGVHILAPADMIIHAVAHLIADGELDGGLRNLWDIDRLLRENAETPDFWHQLAARADHHQLRHDLNRTLRLSHTLYATPIGAPFTMRLTLIDRLFSTRLRARNSWGQNTHRPLRLAFTIRGHLMRMPLPMLLRHLWIKWRRKAAPN